MTSCREREDRMEEIDNTLTSYSSQSTLELNTMTDSSPGDNEDHEDHGESTMSLGNSSTDINVSTDLHTETESTLDLQEITQSILDLEETQATSSSLGYGMSAEMQKLSQVPSSPPPSYEHVLAETRMAAQAAAMAETPDGQSGSSEEGGCKAKVPEERGSPVEAKRGVEIMHKSHKEFYRAVAKQWGITCKMSDHCRCLDCQSMYFDCEYDQNEQEKTDGGLGAGTPMFISEVMHGSACTLL